MWNKKAIFVLFACVAAQPAQAIMLMEDELNPKPQFSERLPGRGGAGFSARLLTSIGQDVVETTINEQTEKRLFAALGLAAQAFIPFTDKIRLDVAASAVRASGSTLVEENSGWKKADTQSEVMARGHAHYQLNDGLRIGAGAVWVMRPAAQETFEFAGQSAMKRLSGYSFWTPDFSAGKEGSGWSAGLGWRPRVTQSRTFVREGADETVEVSEDVSLDELWSIGIVSQLGGSRTLRLDVNLHGSNSSQTRETSSSDGSTSTSTSEDNSRRRYEVGIILSLAEFGGHSWSLGGSYQSIGYSDQSNVTPQNIPLWGVLLRDEFKQADVNMFVDGLFGLGTDLQSLPDLNAKYKRTIFSMQTGVRF